MTHRPLPLDDDYDDKQNKAYDRDILLFFKLRSFVLSHKMKLVFLLALVGSALIVQASQSVHEAVAYSGSVSSSHRSVTKHQSLMASQAVPEMMEEDAMEMDEAEPAMMDMKMSRTSSSGGSSMGKTVLDAFDTHMKEVHDDSVKNLERMLVRNGHLSLLAWKGELQSLAESIESLVKKDDIAGYVESRNSHQNNYDSYKLLSMDLQLRVPSEHFEQVLRELQSLVEDDMIQSVSMDSHDVTDQYVDASTRADTLEASRKALRTLLEKAANVNDIMQVQRELNRLTQQYESERKRAQSLQKEARWSRLSVHFQEKNRPDETKPSSYFWTPSKAFGLAWEHMGSACTFLGDTIVYMLAWMIPLVVLYFALVYPITRAYNMKR